MGSSLLHQIERATTYDNEILEAFLPVSLRELLEAVTPLLPEEDREAFSDVTRVLAALCQHEAFGELQELKRLYRPFSPDSDLLPTGGLSDEQRQQRRDGFLERVYRLLDRANYLGMDEDQINAAIAEQSPYGLALRVELDDFDELALFVRGCANGPIEVRSWKTLFRKRRIIVPIYRRLAMVIKLKPGETAPPDWLSRMGIRRSSRGDGPMAAMRDDAIYLKLFRDVARCDLEMLFPNTRVQMKPVDKLKVGATGLGATAMGVIKATPALGAAMINPIGAMTALGGLLGVLFKQISNIFNLRTRYAARLAQNLYVHALDNSAGVFTRLVDLVVEERCKEAVLAFAFLCVDRSQPWRLESLDRRVERFVFETYNLKVNYDVDDGLSLLRSLGLVSLDDDGTIHAQPPRQARCTLDRRWDGLFRFDPFRGSVASPAEASPHGGDPCVDAAPRGETVAGGSG